MGESAGLLKEQRQNRDSTESSLDVIDRSLLELLQREGRITLSELGRRVSLSPAAVGERVKRLEAEGTITGYTALVTPSGVGLVLRAFVRMAPHGGFGIRHPRTRKIMDRPEILELHHVVGEDCWILKIAVRDTTHLEELLEDLSVLGSTTTSIVMSSPIERRVLLPL